jgi:hypothetical protein
MQERLEKTGLRIGEAAGGGYSRGNRRHRASVVASYSG